MTDAAQRTSVTVRIAGEDYTLRTNADADYTRRCAELVDQRIERIREGGGLVDRHKAAILAALSIADELFQARGRARELDAETADRVDRLVGALEEVLADGG